MIANSGSNALKMWDSPQFYISNSLVDYGSGRRIHTNNDGNAVSQRVASLSICQTEEGIMPLALYDNVYWGMTQETQLSVKRFFDLISDYTTDEATYKMYENLKLLDDVKQHQNENEEDYVSAKVIENARALVVNIVSQPAIFKTHRNSIQFEYELTDGSYLEFELFEDRLTCMEIPRAEAGKAIFPNVSYDDLGGINRIIRGFMNEKN